MHEYNVVIEIDGIIYNIKVNADTPAHAAFSVGISTGMTDETVEDGRVKLLDVFTLR